MTFALLGTGIVIILEGALSYLGLGIPPPGAELGQHDRAGRADADRVPRARADPEPVPVRHRASG